MSQRCHRLLIGIDSCTPPDLRLWPPPGCAVRYTLRAQAREIQAAWRRYLGAKKAAAEREAYEARLAALAATVKRMVEDESSSVW
jgi:hypothetical protein